MAASSLVPLDEERARVLDRYIDEHQRRRQGNKILHGYPPPLRWRERRVPVDDVLALRRRTGLALPKKLLVYVGSPYCLPTEPDRCGFCLFPSAIYRSRSQLDEYLDYLEREGRMYRDHPCCPFEDTRLDAVYFGGGTANLYDPEQYHRLVDLVAEILGPIPSAAEVTLEGVPQLFTREKLVAMKEAGINRISIGAQQLDEERIALSGRRQTAQQVIRAIQWCHELGLPSSVDLIFGWPRQRVEHMLRDLEALVATGVGHVTHYELNVAGRSAFALERREELPSREENLEMYRQAKGFLEAAGYRQRTLYDWEQCGSELPADYRFEKSWHRPLRSPEPGKTEGVDLWGWGFAGVSCFPGAPDDPGWTYLHHTRVPQYFESLDEGRFPIERGYRFSASDLRLNVLFQMLHSMSVDLGEYRRLFAVDLLAEHAAVWAVLMRRGWIEVEGERLTVIADGVFHTPLIQTLLAGMPARGGRVART